MGMHLRQERLGVIDILRVFSVVMVFLFHSNMHIFCNYGFLTDFISMGAIFMTAFFMISGFILSYVSVEKTYNDNHGISNFYKKRIISIMPLYWFIAIVYPIWDIFVNGNSFIYNLILAPIEFLGLQSVFHSFFSYTHNGGTWFVSCILFCYLVFPFVYNMINDKNLKTKIVLMVICVLILLYSPILVRFMSIENIYSNSFFRLLEFFLGMLLFSIWLNVKETRWYAKFFANYFFEVSIFFLLVVTVSLLVKNKIFISDYMAYSWLGIPCFSALIFAGAGIKTPRLITSKLLKYFVDISYAFFFAQFFTWKITSKIINLTHINSNLFKIVLSFTICIVIAVLIHELIEKPFKKVLSKKIIFTE